MPYLYFRKYGLDGVEVQFHLNKIDDVLFDGVIYSALKVNLRPFA